LKPLKLKIKLIDKRKIYTLKAKYDPLTRIAESKRGFRGKNRHRFEIDPDHIYEEFGKGLKPEYVAYVNNANRKSVEISQVKTIFEKQNGKLHKKKQEVKETVEVNPSLKIHTDDPVDPERTIKLDMLIDIAFWKSLMEKRKIALSTILITLFAGVGLYHFLLVVLRMLGFQV